LIAGPYDGSGRFLYWLRRTALDKEMLAPGAPNLPVQLIDARDLASWIIRMAESRNTGIYNATGPPSMLTFQQMLECCKMAAGSHTHMTWIDNEFLLKNGVAPFSDLPFWLPLDTHKGFFAIDCRRAFAAGLVCRPLTETAHDTVLWDRAAGSQGQIGLNPDREKELLELWKG
jgi:2'-hydroxyisoflavone reductase